jgi:hypothetical protein
MEHLSLESSHQYAFIHIPKNGGMSIGNAIKDTVKIKYYGHAVLFKNIRHLKQIIVLRDPIDRFTSAFFYLKQYKKNKSRDIFNNPDELIQGFINFDINSFNFLKIHDGFHHVNGNPINTDWVFHKQSAWVDNPYKILLFESLEDDLDKFGSEIGESLHIPHVNKSKKQPFTYSKSSLDFLNIIYKDDMELYNSLLNSR